MPQKKAFSSANDVTIFLDKNIVDDMVRMKSQIDISNGGWRIDADMFGINLKKNNVSKMRFDTNGGLRVAKIRSDSFTLSTAAGCCAYPKFIANRMRDMHHAYISPNTVERAPDISDQYIVSTSGRYYARYTPTGAGNINMFVLYERTPVINNTHAFAEIINTTFVGISNMNNSIVAGDHNFDTIFEMLPFYDYNGAIDVGMLRIYSRSSSRLTLVQTLTDTSFSMSNFIVSDDGGTILIVSSNPSDSIFRVYKKQAGAAEWSLFFERNIIGDSLFASFAQPIAISRDGANFVIRARNGSDLPYCIIAYKLNKNVYDKIAFPALTSAAIGSSSEFCPSGSLLMLNDSDNMHLYIFEFKNNEWCTIAAINSTSIMRAAFNGRYIATIKSVDAGPDEFVVYGVSSKNDIHIVGRYDAIRGSSNVNIRIDDNDVIWYMHVDANLKLTRLLPIGASFRTMVTRDIKVVRPYTDAPASDIGSAKNVYSNLYSQNGITISSDEKLKENITPLNNAIDIIRALRAVSYKSADGSDDDWHHCVLAQNGQHMRYEEMIPLIIGAINNIETRINALNVK